MLAELHQHLAEAATPLLEIYRSILLNLIRQLGEPYRQLVCEYNALVANLDAQRIQTTNNSAHAYQQPNMSDEEVYVQTGQGLRKGPGRV